MIDVDVLAAPVSEDSPSGDDLEYDADFLELERLAQGKPEQHVGNTVVPAEEPDWRAVETLALDLLGRTKDIRVAVRLARALLHRSGPVGFAQGLGLIRRLVEEHWPTVHPQLDPEDDDDPTMRINALVAIQDPLGILRPLREAPLVRAPRVGLFSLRDILIARNEMPAPAESEPVPPGTIEAAFADMDPEALIATADAIHASIADLRGIETFVGDQVGSHQAPDLSPLSRTLRDMDRVLSEQVGRLGLGADAAGQVTPDGADPVEEQQRLLPARPSGAAAVSGEIRTRADVIRTIDVLLDYYRTEEPSSPVPLLLRRAKRLVPMNFLEIVRELAPDGLSQLEIISGPDTSDESSDA